MKIYVASSWRNPSQQTVVQALRGAGHDVYDFATQSRATPDSAGASAHLRRS